MCDCYKKCWKKLFYFFTSLWFLRIWKYQKCYVFYQLTTAQLTSRRYYYRILRQLRIKIRFAGSPLKVPAWMLLKASLKQNSWKRLIFKVKPPPPSPLISNKPIEQGYMTVTESVVVGGDKKHHEYIRKRKWSFLKVHNLYLPIIALVKIFLLHGMWGELMKKKVVKWSREISSVGILVNTTWL